MASYKPPSPESIAAAAQRLGMTLTPEGTKMYARYGAELAFAYHRVDALEEYLPIPNPLARKFVRPPPEANRYGAWLVTSSIKRDVTGKLSGKRIAIKDTVAVAGLPMNDGTDFWPMCRRSTQRSSTVSSPRAARLPARLCVNFYPFPAAAIPLPAVTLKIRLSGATRPAARPRGAQR